MYKDVIAWKGWGEVKRFWNKPVTVSEPGLNTALGDSGFESVYVKIALIMDNIKALYRTSEELLCDIHIQSQESMANPRGDGKIWAIIRETTKMY